MRIFFIVTVVVLLVSCSAHSVKPNFAFGNRLAANGLWNEAVYRWTLSLAEEGDSAAIHNNLAVAYEQLGRFDEAEKEYKKALQLDAGSQMIKANYEFFKKNMEKRQK